MAASQDALSAVYMDVGVSALVPSTDATVATFENIGNAAPVPSLSAVGAQFQNVGVSTVSSQTTTGATFEYVLPKPISDQGSFFIGWGDGLGPYVAAVPVPSSLITWYDVSRMAGYSSGQSMTTLIDYSGQSSHATANNATKGLYSPASTPTGMPSVEMGKTANTSFRMTEYFMPGTAGHIAEIFVVLKARSAAAISGMWTIGPYTGASDQSYYTYSDGTVYENFGRTSGSRISFTPTLAATSWRVYNVYAGISDWKAYIDAVQQATSATVTNPDYSSLWLLGEGRRSGGVTADSYFSGWIAEVLLYNRVLTAPERAQTNTYLQKKHITG